MSRAPARDHTTWRSARGELGRFCGTDGRFRDTPASLSRGRALAQQFPNHREQLARFERLDQRARRAQSRRGLQHLDLTGPAPTRHGDDLRLGMLGTKGADHRSEERRVGKECRSEWTTYTKK